MKVCKSESNSLIIVLLITSGNQYHYNVRKDMYCEELAPLLLMYDRGKLVGFAWFFVSDISSPVYEKIPPPMYSVSHSTVYSVLLSMFAWTICKCISFFFYPYQTYYHQKNSGKMLNEDEILIKVHVINIVLIGSVCIASRIIIINFILQRMFQPVPDCLYTMGQVTSLHIFLTNQYNEISCSSK